MVLRGGFLYTFAENNGEENMSVFLAILIMMTTGAVALFIIVRNMKSQNKADNRTRSVLSFLCLTNIMVFCNLLCGGKAVVLRLPFDMLIAMVPMLVITSSAWENDAALKLSRCFSIPIGLVSLFYILNKIELLSMPASVDFISMSGVVAILMCVIHMFALSIRMREIRLVMKHGNVWSSVCMTMDMMYIFCMIVDVLLLMMSAWLSAECTYVISFVVSLLLAGELAALGLRVSMDSLFLVWRRHERRIIESMKISHSDVSQDTSKINDIYKEIYTRLVAFFEEEKPYLNSELTINDIVRVTFTNKLYISRAISQFTGKNFCQFVNYYRVNYSIQLFRDNPDLKVIELATRSGFNSTVSYSMAFRLYMSETPSDWCRKEKMKLCRRKK